MRIQRKKHAWHPLLAKLINFAPRDEKLTRKLVKQHPEALTLRTSIGETALHYLAVEDCPQAVALLIELGADVDVKKHFGDSALDEALLIKNADVVKILRDHGARESDHPHIESQ